MKNWIYLSMLLIGMSSCANPYQKEIEEISEMQTVLSGVKSTYSDIDVTKVTHAMETYEKNMHQIQLYYNPDTIDLKVAGLLDFYKGVKNSAKGFETEFSLLGQNIVFMENQLKTLKQDLEGRVDFEDSLSIFMEREKNNLEILQQNIATISYNYDYIVSVHDSIANKVQSIIIENVE